MSLRQIMLVGVLALVLAVLGVWLGRMLQPAPLHPETELHALMHEHLSLNPVQEQQLEMLERDFSAQRRTLETRLRTANSRLAEAVAAEHVYGPRVSEAVDATHHAMGDLQKATLEHVFAMRAILRPEQQAQFDAVVDKTLTTPQQ